jgi:hypothetical protein
MKEALYYASEELKRAEHLLYVSLKYTRTGDVIKSLVARLISCFDHVIDGMLKIKEEEGAIIEVPSMPFAKVNTVKKLYSEHKEMLDYLDFYLLLRKISRDVGESRKEFRRHLTLTVSVDGKKIELTIDIMGDYYHRTVEFLSYVKKLHILEEK